MGNIITPGSNQPPTMNLDFENMDTYVCDKCGNDLFQQLFIFKKASALQSPTGKEALLPLHVAFACVNCGHVSDEIGQKSIQKLRGDLEIQEKKPTDKTLQQL